MTYSQLASDLHAQDTPVNQTLTPMNYTQVFAPHLKFADMTSAFNYWHDAHNLTMLELKIFSFVNLVLNIIQILIMMKMIHLQGRQFFKRAYSWIDMIFYALNILISFEIFDMIRT